MERPPLEPTICLSAAKIDDSYAYDVVERMRIIYDNALKTIMMAAMPVSIHISTGVLKSLPPVVAGQIAMMLGDYADGIIRIFKHGETHAGPCYYASILARNGDVASNDGDVIIPSRSLPHFLEKAIEVKCRD